MLYKCLKCEHQVAAGCLPTATCGLYFFGLMALVPAMLLCLVVLIRWLAPVPPPPPDTPEPDTPWWVWVVSVAATPVLLIGGAWVLDFLFRTVERFLVRRRKCPECGSQTWSKGYTRGFGL